MMRPAKYRLLLATPLSAHVSGAAPGSTFTITSVPSHAAPPSIAGTHTATACRPGLRHAPARVASATPTPPPTMATTPVDTRMLAPINRPRIMDVSTVSTSTAGTPNRCPNRQLASIAHGSAHTPTMANGMRAVTI